MREPEEQGGLLCIFSRDGKLEGETEEGRQLNCFIKLLAGTSIECGLYSIQSENIENYEDFIVTDLKITNSLTGEERHVCHFQFTSWPDYGTPDSALSMLQFLQVC